MKRVFQLIVIVAFASVGAADAHAQSRRVYRVEPPKEEQREEKSGKKDEAQEGEAKGEAKDGQQQSQDKAQAGGGGDDDEPDASKEITTRAVIKSKPNPAYPHEARRHGVRGTVKLRIIFGADGKIGDKIDVLEGLPHGVTEEAIKAARRIKFEPARKGDRPVSRNVIILYHFNLY